MLRSAFLVALFVVVVVAKKSTPGEKPSWAKKDIRFYSEADMERLLDQWEEDEEPLEPDELPEHLRPPVKIDPNLVGNDPDALLKLSKKGKTLMTFVKVSPKLQKEEVEKITKLWQSSLWNNHIQAERYMVDDNRAIFMYKDGSQAWDAKDFLVQQEDCVDVTIENQVFKGPATPFVQGNVEKNFFFIYVIGFLDIASLGIIMPAFNRRLIKFGATHFQITLLESLFSGFQLITSPIVGTLSDRYGRKPLLLLSMIFSVFAFFAMGLCDTYLSIAIIRLMLGCFKHTQMLGKSLIGDNVPKSQHLSVHGKLNSFISLSFMIAPVYGGYLSERVNGFYYLACSTSLLCAINVIIVATSVPTKKIRKSSIQKNMFHHLKEVDWLEYWPLLFMRMMYTATLSTLIVSFGFVLIETFKLSPSQVGYTISVNSSIGVATGFAVPRLESFFRKYNSFKKCFFSFILLCVGYICLAFAPNLVIYMLCMIPISAAGTLIEVFLNQILSETCKDHNRGTLEGAMTSSISVARSITPMVAGLAMDIYGSSGAYIFAALAAISAAMLAKLYDNHIKKL